MPKKTNFWQNIKIS